MKEKVNSLIQKTNGKKTEATSLLMVAFQIIMLWRPGLISTTAERTIDIIISSGVISALGHRIWRNRKEIITFISAKYKNIKNKIKK